MRRSRVRWGISLGEVLIVLAVIVLLAAILTPVYLRSKAQSLRTLSISQLRSLSVAQYMYMSENGGGYATGVGNATGHWMEQLRPYLPEVYDLHPPMWAGPVDSNDLISTGYAINTCQRPQWKGAFVDEALAVGFAETTAFRPTSGGAWGSYSIEQVSMPDRLYFESLVAAHEKIAASEPFASLKYDKKGAYAMLDGHSVIVGEDRFHIDRASPCQATAKLPSDKFVFSRQ